MSYTNYARGPGGRDDNLAQRLARPQQGGTQRIVPIRRTRSVGAQRLPGVGRPLLRVQWLAQKVLATYEVKYQVAIDRVTCEGEPVQVEICKDKDGASASLATQSLATDASLLEGSWTYGLADGDLEGALPRFSLKASVKGQTLESRSIPLELLPDPFEALQWRLHGAEKELEKNGLCGVEVDLHVQATPISAPDGTEVAFEVHTHAPVEGEPAKVADLTAVVANAGATTTWTYAYEPPAEGQLYWKPAFTFQAKATIKDGRELESEPSKALPFYDRLQLQLVDERGKPPAISSGKKQYVVLTPPDGGKGTKREVRKGKVAFAGLPGTWKLVGLTPDHWVQTIEPGPLA